VLAAIYYLFLPLIVHAGTCLSQPLLWTCPTSTDNERSYFPNISFHDDFLANSVRGSPYLSGLYVYRFQPLINSSCNSIPLIEFCYEISEKDSNNNNTSIVMSILLGSIDSVKPSGKSFTGRVFIQETVNESTVDCNIKKVVNNSVCCQSVRINVTLSTQLLQQVNALGVEFPDQILLEYSNDSQNNIVETFVATSQDFRGFVSTGNQEPVLMLQGNGHFMDLSLRYLRLVIEESPNPQNTNTTLSLALVIVLPIVGGLTVTFLSIIAVLIFAVWWRKQKKVIMDKDPQKALDNANC
jgi:hypothetical protein